MPEDSNAEDSQGETIVRVSELFPDDTQEPVTESKPRQLLLAGMPIGTGVSTKLKQEIWDNAYVDLAQLLAPYDTPTQYQNIKLRF